jgi:hypothetical protein
MTHRDDSYIAPPSDQIDSDRAYIMELHQLAASLRVHASRARRRSIYGLEDRLREAAESAASWADAIENHLPREVEV